MLLVNRERMESQVPEDSRACLDRRETRVRGDSLDPLDPSVYRLVLIQSVRSRFNTSSTKAVFLLC